MELLHEKNRVFCKDECGTVTAEVTFPEGMDGTVIINHTFVDESLRGQGVAGRLLTEAAAQLRQEGRKARPTCSYAVGWFEKHPEYADILAK